MNFNISEFSSILGIMFWTAAPLLFLVLVVMYFLGERQEDAESERKSERKSEREKPM